MKRTIYIDTNSFAKRIMIIQQIFERMGIDILCVCLSFINTIKYNKVHGDYADLSDSIMDISETNRLLHSIEKGIAIHIQSIINILIRFTMQNRKVHDEIWIEMLFEEAIVNVLFLK